MPLSDQPPLLRGQASHGAAGVRINSREAATHLDCTLGHLYKLTSRKAIPHYKPRGKRLLFLKADLDEYLLGDRIERVDHDGEAMPSSGPTHLRSPHSTVKS